MDHTLQIYVTQYGDPLRDLSIPLKHADLST